MITEAAFLHPGNRAWRCPPPPVALDFGLRSKAEVVCTALRNLSKRAPGAVSAIGLELRVAMLLLEFGLASDADNAFWAAKCRKLFLRPAVEPIAYSYWPRLTEQRLDEDSARQLTSALVGKKVESRIGVVGRSSRGDVEFESVEFSKTWLLDISKAASGACDPLAMPAYTFARVVMSHPFTDGNGRLARVLTQASLAKLVGLRYPTLALTPFFYTHALSITTSLDHLNETSDWHPLCSAIFDLVEEASRIVSAISET